MSNIGYQNANLDANALYHLANNNGGQQPGASQVSGWLQQLQQAGQMPAGIQQGASGISPAMLQQFGMQGGMPQNAAGAMGVQQPMNRPPNAAPQTMPNGAVLNQHSLAQGLTQIGHDPVVADQQRQLQILQSLNKQGGSMANMQNLQQGMQQPMQQQMQQTMPQLQQPMQQPVVQQVPPQSGAPPQNMQPQPPQSQGGAASDPSRMLQAAAARVLSAPNSAGIPKNHLAMLYNYHENIRKASRPIPQYLVDAVRKMGSVGWYLEEPQQAVNPAQLQRPAPTGNLDGNDAATQARRDQLSAMMRNELGQQAGTSLVPSGPGMPNPQAVASAQAINQARQQQQQQQQRMASGQTPLLGSNTLLGPNMPTGASQLGTTPVVSNAQLQQSPAANGGSAAASQLNMAQLQQLQANGQLQAWQRQQALQQQQHTPQQQQQQQLLQLQQQQSAQQHAQRQQVPPASQQQPLYQNQQFPPAVQQPQYQPQAPTQQAVAPPRPATQQSAVGQAPASVVPKWNGQSVRVPAQPFAVTDIGRMLQTVNGHPPHLPPVVLDNRNLDYALLLHHVFGIGGYRWVDAQPNAKLIWASVAQAALKSPNTNEAIGLQVRDIYLTTLSAAEQVIISFQHLKDRQLQQAQQAAQAANQQPPDLAQGMLSSRQPMQTGFNGQQAGAQQQQVAQQQLQPPNFGAPNVQQRQPSAGGYAVSTDFANAVSANPAIAMNDVQRQALEMTRQLQTQRSAPPPQPVTTMQQGGASLPPQPDTAAALDAQAQLDFALQQQNPSLQYQFQQVQMQQQQQQQQQQQFRQRTTPQQQPQQQLPPPGLPPAQAGQPGLSGGVAGDGTMRTLIADILARQRQMESMLENKYANRPPIMPKDAAEKQALQHILHQISLMLATVSTWVSVEIMQVFAPPDLKQILAALVQFYILGKLILAHANKGRILLSLEDLTSMQERLRVAYRQVHPRLDAIISDPRAAPRMQQAIEELKAQGVKVNVPAASSMAMQPPVQPGLPGSQPQAPASLSAALLPQPSPQLQQAASIVAVDAVAVPSLQTTLSAEAVNATIPRPVRAETLKQPPKGKKRGANAAAAGSPQVGDDAKVAPTPSDTGATPAAVATPTPPKRANKRKASTSQTPKMTKKTKGDDGKDAKMGSPAVVTPLMPAATPDTAGGPPPPARPEAPRAIFTGNALCVTLADTADRAAAEAATAEAERALHAPFFAARRQQDKSADDLVREFLLQVQQNAAALVAAASTLDDDDATLDNWTPPSFGSATTLAGSVGAVTPEAAATVSPAVVMATTHSPVRSTPAAVAVSPVDAKVAPGAVDLPTDPTSVLLADTPVVPLEPSLAVVPINVEPATAAPVSGDQKAVLPDVLDNEVLPNGLGADAILPDGLDLQDPMLQLDGDLDFSAFGDTDITANDLTELLASLENNNYEYAFGQ